MRHRGCPRQVDAAADVPGAAGQRHQVVDHAAAERREREVQARRELRDGVAQGIERSEAELPGLTRWDSREPTYVAFHFSSGDFSGSSCHSNR